MRPFSRLRALSGRKHHVGSYRGYAVGAALVLLLGAGCSDLTGPPPTEPPTTPPVLIKDAVGLAAVLVNILDRNIPFVPETPDREVLVRAVNQAGLSILASAVTPARQALDEARTSLERLGAQMADDHAVLVELDSISMEVDALDLALSQLSSR